MTASITASSLNDCRWTRRYLQFLWTPPDSDWRESLTSLYCTGDSSHSISLNLSDFQTQLTRWQTVVRPIQCDSVWFYRQPWNEQLNVHILMNQVKMKPTNPTTKHKHIFLMHLEWFSTQDPAQGLLYA